MSDKHKKQTSNPNPSTPEIPTQLSLSSPSVPNQTGKSTKERIDEQIGTRKDALAIPFLTSPPASSHDGTKIPTPPKSSTTQPSLSLPPKFHYTPYTTYYDLRQPSVQPHPILSPYHHPATTASTIPPYPQHSHMNPPMPDFHYQAPPHQPFSTPHHPSSTFSHETTTPRPQQHHHHQYTRPDPREEQLDRANAALRTMTVVTLL
ncbi:hypothetical protein PCASD_06950 [Puccinia coronata f. sp. avenae]|uniref:Uncharacterized protein n=1 Tax=Puccinia coronata f. sp. avenae TaxID=200324 RepID=A0A2N5V4T0_9BASI|nr:hypothetical protein PCASD_06950 [Puccinia coronata f. sp. avenae]